jgi:hypothetical protein
MVDAVSMTVAGGTVPSRPSLVEDRNGTGIEDGYGPYSCSHLGKTFPVTNSDVFDLSSSSLYTFVWDIFGAMVAMNNGRDMW